MYESQKYVESICIFPSFLTHDTAQRIALNNGLNESSCFMNETSGKKVSSEKVLNNSVQHR